ncbi:hypothetical protein CLU79DRAFT_779815 [Phycomyces nitens]|nr:hypothetical protein CLU79DRAFT_779815 [Phycomyces nitens]
MAGMPYFAHSLAPYLYTFPIQPSRSSISTSELAARMANLVDIFPNLGIQVGPSQDRLLCDASQLETANIRELAMEPNSLADECVQLPLVPMDTSIPVSPVEPSPTISPENLVREGHGHHHHAQLAISHLVPPLTDHSRRTPLDHSSPSRPSGTRRRSSHTGEESPLVIARLERKRQRLLANGFEDKAIHVMLSPDRQRSRQQYSSSQNKYISWANEHQIDPFTPNPAHIVNFIAFGHSQYGWSPSTCHNYRSAILDLYGNDKAVVTDDIDFRDFFTALNDTTVCSFHRPIYDLQPVFATFRTWGPNDSMTVSRLTHKLCWLLAITGFLRPSDIERINLDETEFSSLSSPVPTLVLAIDCPKEKRSGQPIVRSVHIRPHLDPVLCPVLSFQSYMRRMVSAPCRQPHPVRSNRTINYLIRHVRNPSSPIHAERISKYINFVTDLIRRPGNSRRPRARALGSTAAARYGIPLDDILTHGSWASSSVFDTFYRLSRETASDFTTAALGPSLPHLALNTQSESPTREV